MAADNKLGVELTGDNAGLVAALAQAEEKIAKLSGKGKEDVDKLGEAFEALSMKHIASAAIGFGTLAGAAEKALDLVMEGLKFIIEIIPKAIEGTGKLVESFEQLHITADMSIEDFNKWTATIKLSGGKTEDLETLVTGMARGIKRNSESLIENGIATDSAALKHMSMGEYISKVVEEMEKYSTANEKNQLLMDAFGRGGIQFANMLTKIAERQEEGQKIAAQTHILDQQAWDDTENLEKAKGRLAIQEDILNRRIASSTAWGAIAIANKKAEVIESYNLNAEAQRLVETGEIIAVQQLQQLEGENVMVTNWEATDALAREFLQTRFKITVEAQKEAKEKKMAEAEATYKSKEDTARKKQEEKDAEKAAELALATRKQLVDLGHRLNTEDLATAENVTVQQKQALAIRQAQDKLQGSLRSIDTTLEKSPGQANQEAAEAARLIAHKLFADQLTKIDRDARAAQEKIDDEAEKRERHEANKVEDLKLADKVRNIQAQAALDVEEVNFQKVIGKVSDESAIQQIQALNARKYEAERAAILDRMALRAKEKELDMAAVQKLENELKQMQIKFNLETKKSNDALYLGMRKKSPMAGIQDGAQQYVKGAMDHFKNFGQGITTILNAAESGVQNAMIGMINGQMTFGQAMKSIWTGIGTAVIQVVTGMIAQWAVAAIAAAIFGTTTKVVENEKAAAALDTGAAEAWAAYGWMPFIGPSLAMGQIALQMASFTAAKVANRAATAYSTGGLVTQPHLGLVGEAGYEYIVPEKSMASLIPGLMESGARIYGAIAKSQARVNSSIKNSNYAPTSNQRTTNNQGHTFNISGVIGDKRALGSYLKGVINQHTLVFGSAI